MWEHIACKKHVDTQQIYELPPPPKSAYNNKTQQDNELFTRVLDRYHKHLAYAVQTLKATTKENVPKKGKQKNAVLRTERKQEIVESGKRREDVIRKLNQFLADHASTSAPQRKRIVLDVV